MTKLDPAAQSPVHIIVTCSNRKSDVVPDRLRMADLRGHTTGRRFTDWTQRLSTSTDPDRPAIDLYAGEHWQIARTLPLQIAPRPATLWVCSAGYGLIAAHTPIQPYAATFAGGGLDSVGEDRTSAREWWTRLTQWPGPARGEPRSFVDLARRDPNATIIAVLSEAYQRACAADIMAATQLLGDGEQMSVIGPATTELADVIVPVTARLQPLLGGSLLALNARVAALLLSSAEDDQDLRRQRLRARVEQSTVSAPARAVRAAGQRMTDEEVRAFIGAHVEEPGVSATSLLRRLRQSGRSCEQGRFGQMFAEIAATAAGR
ncbi:hypothetical protein AB0368_06550 [Actinoplanes sp. NPDC051475]|uniref:hypothetical protein n=1 Tax=Actinoplanes sp. NPDC051475 TaxID=3157225 RepID=UPI00344BD0B7